MAGKHNPHAPIGTCISCGKQCFATRKSARGFMKRKHPDDPWMTIYRCGEYFHYGHTPYPVARGFKARRSS